MENSKNHLLRLSEILLPIIRQAGDIVLSAARNRDNEVEAFEKGSPTHVNFVTRYDTRVQEFLIDRLSKALPEAGFLAEESDDGQGVRTCPGQSYCFVIDPIDGTKNFIHDLEMSCVSVGLLCEGVPVLGMINHPYAGRTCYAVAGGGCFSNGAPVSASRRIPSMGLAGIGTSPYDKEKSGKLTVALFEKMLTRFSDVRRTGSAALDFSLVASGKLDAFAEAKLSPWDYCAGYLLTTESGGVCTDFNGRVPDFYAPSSILCANAVSHQTLRDIISEISNEQTI